MNWIEMIAKWGQDYGVHIDRKEGFFLCPECGEPIYRSDWDLEELAIGCPVCGFEWFED